MASNGLKFWKYHGIGNDFVLIDARELKGIDWPALSTQMCDRHFGVGADGLLLLRPSEVASYTMGMYNPDGSEAQMCGNGIRGFAKHLVDHALVLGDEMTVETGAGVLGLRLNNDRHGKTSVTVGMGKPITAGRRIPVESDRDPVLQETIEGDFGSLSVTCVSMGNPHAVHFVEHDPEQYDLAAIGPRVENHPFFPERVNYEIAQVLDRTRIKMRVWERGAGLTLACGTGACATLVAARLEGRVDAKATVGLPGGDLAVHWDGDQVWMTGPAELVFVGEWSATVPTREVVESTVER